MTSPALAELKTINRYESDKSEDYLRQYEKCFAELRMQPLTLMEIGVERGGSLLMWRDYFCQGNIVGVDMNPPFELADETGRVKMFQCEQSDAQRLDLIASQASPGGYNIIVDDASHIAALSAITFRTLFYRHLKPGGFYAIEDWGTGYWSWWPDGELPTEIADGPMFLSQDNHFISHQRGMVGFVKQLVDECGLADVYHPHFGIPGSRKSYIRSMVVSAGLVIIEKAV